MRERGLVSDQTEMENNRMPTNPLKNIPSVHELLESEPLKKLVDTVSHNVVVTEVRSFLDNLRDDLREATVDVKNAVIGGKLLGNIRASNKIELQTGSHVEGDIQTARLVIDEGVFFEGSCKMGTQSGAPSKPSFEKEPEKKEMEKQTVK